MTGHRPWIVPVGGFLGAGKTTLILAAAKLLARRGVRCAAVLNDQAGALVDTAYARHHGLPANEVAGGCFCCRFSEMIDRIEDLRAASPEVIFVEPVGSCTDLAATILQPLQREYRDRYRVAPLTVLVDPARARELAAIGRNADFGFLFDHQLAEADFIVFTKRDLQGIASPMHLSAVTGEGVAEWIDAILSGTHTSGSKLLDLNYQRYAQAEAALGWLNWRAGIGLNDALSPAQLIGPFIDALRDALITAGAHIGHLKLLDETPGSYLKAAFTTDRDEPHIEGDLTASPVNTHHLTLNLRATLEPAALATVFRSQLTNIPGKLSEEAFECFSPLPPKPERGR